MSTTYCLFKNLFNSIFSPLLATPCKTTRSWLWDNTAMQRSCKVHSSLHCWPRKRFLPFLPSSVLPQQEKDLKDGFSHHWRKFQKKKKKITDDVCCHVIHIYCQCAHSSAYQPVAIIQWEQRLQWEFQHAFTWAGQVELTYCTFAWLHLSKQEPGKTFSRQLDECAATQPTRVSVFSA